MDDDKRFLGKGMAFPPKINMSTGRFETSDENKSVKESVYIILMTQKTERWIRPNFGSEIMSYTFLDINETMVNVIKREIIACIKENEPRVSDVEIHLDAVSKPGYLIFDIEYTVASTNTRDNLVFPFYLNQSDEEEETDEAVEKV